jgi:hypothetical protein
MAKTSRIILAKNIKIDRNYQNTLTYSEQEMLTLCINNIVAQNNTYSFIRDSENTIRVGFSYETCLKSNYIAFQNSRYSNKWFFAFIDSVSYVSDGASDIHFTIDYFSTWFSYWTPTNTFVIREHVNDDTVGANLIDEGLFLGEFTCNKVNEEVKPFSNCKPVIGVSELIGGPDVMEPIPDYYEHGGIFNGICYIVGQTSPTMTSNIIKAYDENGKADAIQYIFMAPNSIAEQGITHTYQIHGFDYAVNYSIIDSSDAEYHVEFGGNYLNKPTTIDGYTPVNKKLLTSPYCYLIVDPHDGNSYKFNYEDFSRDFYSFGVDAILTPGCSIKITPTHYKGVDYNYMYSFSGAKFPMCSWNSDAYTNWLTQNGVNVGIGTINQNEAAALGGIGSMLLGGLLIASGVGTVAGAGLIAGGAAGMFSSMQSDYKASFLPDQVKGNINTGDINFTLKLFNPICYEMSIKRQIAEKLDDYFTRFGYKVTELKIPNITGRKYFNYVEIGKSEIIGYSNNLGSVPADAMEVINNIFRSGTTLWHDHSRIGNYNDNTINT